jgi:hypothetical protein
MTRKGTPLILILAPGAGKQFSTEVFVSPPISCDHSARHWPRSMLRKDREFDSICVVSQVVSHLSAHNAKLVSEMH